MDRLASMPFPAVLFLIIYGHLVLQTSATFFIELHDRSSGNNARIILYECNVSSTGDSQLTASTTVPSNHQILPLSYTSNQDISCTAVVNKSRRGEVYMIANFYMIVSPRLGGGRRIIVGSDSTELPRTIFMGVITVGDETADYPAFLRDLDVTNLNRLRSKCMVTLPGRFLRTDMNFEAFVGYMSTADFHLFAQPVGLMTTRFTSFAEIVRRVQQVFIDKIVHARRDRVSQEEQSQAESDVKSAVGLLIRKLIDPCFVLWRMQEMGEFVFRNGIPTAPMEVANAMCKHHCMLLRAASSLYPKASGCARAVWDGACVNRVCVCERWRKIFACAGGPRHVAMIKCNNDIRVRLAESSNMGV